MTVEVVCRNTFRELRREKHSMILETNDRVETCNSFGSREGFFRRGVTKAVLKT